MVLARRWHQPRGFAGLLILLVVASNYRVVLGMETFVLRDFSLFGYPLAYHAKESLLQGEIPLWNPLNDCGVPFLAQWNTMCLYPPALLNLLFPLSWSMGVFCLLHQYLGGLGMYFLALRWTRNTHGAAFAGVAFAFGGIMQNSLMWPNNIAALGCLPWVMLGAQVAWQRGGRMLVVAALLAALQLLSGAPEIILITWSVIGLVWLVDLKLGGALRMSMLLRLGVVVGLAALLAAAQLIPFFDLLTHSARLENPDEITWAIGLSGWANFLVPQFDCIDPQSTGVLFHASQAWTHSYYAGLLPCLLIWPAVAGGRHRLAWVLVSLIPLGLILAMGPAGRLYSILDSVLPLEVIRFPVKFTVVCAVVLPLVGAFGIRRLTGGNASLSVIQSTVVLGCLLAIIGMMISRSDQSDAARELSWSGFNSRLIWAILCGGLLFLLLRTRGLQKSLAVLVLVICLQSDLQWHQPSLSPTLDRKYYELPNPVADRFAGAHYPFGRALLSQAAQDHHLKRPSIPFADGIRETRGGLFSNLNLVDHIAKANGFYSMWLPNFGEVIWTAYSGPFDFNPAVADYMSITHVTSRKGPMDWIRRSSALAPVTAGQEPNFLPVSEMPKAMVEPGFDSRRTILVPENARSEFAIGGVKEAAVSDLVMKPHRIQFKVASPRPTVVSVAQSHYHWWRAYVDGVPTSIHVANGAFQAIAVPAGEHAVEMRYEDRGFVLGSWISLLSLLGCLIALARRRAGLSD